tara:strand:+ start:1564 stop:1905 length:342 start_codon:yes stop_codon:yes gene_type:complete
MKWNKYKAIRTEVDGIMFHSKKEAKRYSELKLLEKAGEISQLELQPKFIIQIEGIKICNYIADFRYIDKKAQGTNGQMGTTVVEDVKGVLTPVYRLKKKLVEALYPYVKIREL